MWLTCRETFRLCGIRDIPKQIDGANSRLTAGQWKLVLMFPLNVLECSAGRQPYPCRPPVPLTGRCTQDGGEKLLVSLPGPLQPSANQSSSSNSAHSQHCCFARSASGGKDTRARSNNMGHLQSDAQHSTVGTYSKAALLSHLENNPTLTLKVSNHAFLH